MKIFELIVWWRFFWYSVLLIHSVKSQKIADSFLAVLLIGLAAVAVPPKKPFIALAAFAVAPLQTILIIQYQRSK